MKQSTSKSGNRKSDLHVNNILRNYDFHSRFIWLYMDRSLRSKVIKYPQNTNNLTQQIGHIPNCCHKVFSYLLFLLQGQDQINFQERWPPYNKQVWRGRCWQYQNFNMTHFRQTVKFRWHRHQNSHLHKEFWHIPYGPFPIKPSWWHSFHLMSQFVAFPG